jgi:hypothetical protein
MKDQIVFTTETLSYSTAIIFISLTSSYASRGLGLAVSILICALCAFLCFAMVFAGAGRYLFLTGVVWPVLSWLGFAVGRALRRKFT